MRCKNCKEKFEAYEFNGKFCKEIDCQVQKALYLVDKDRTAKKKKQAEKMKRINKEVREQKKKVYPEKHKKLLQDQINLLARKIDVYFGYTCIDCERPLKEGEIHGAHRNNVGGNENIRFNLHNIHASTNFCNMFNTEHKPGYDKGLKSRYSEEYYQFVRFGLKQEYKSINLMTHEIDSALKIVRKLNRDFDKVVLVDSISARNMFNKIIGIYK
jgi:hypothetical protein